MWIFRYVAWISPAGPIRTDVLWSFASPSTRSGKLPATKWMANSRIQPAGKPHDDADREHREGSPTPVERRPVPALVVVGDRLAEGPLDPERNRDQRREQAGREGDDPAAHVAEAQVGRPGKRREHQ